MIEIPINQIRSLEKPLKASAIAPLVDSGLVTPVAATNEIATIETPLSVKLYQ